MNAWGTSLLTDHPDSGRDGADWQRDHRRDDQQFEGTRHLGEKSVYDATPISFGSDQQIDGKFRQQ